MAELLVAVVVYKPPYVGLKTGSLLSLDCEPPNCFIKRLHAATPSCFFALAISFLSKKGEKINHFLNMMSQQPSSTANHLKGSQWKKRMNKVKIQ